MKVIHQKMIVIAISLLVLIAMMYSSDLFASSTTKVEESYETVSFDIETAIVNRGFVIDFKGDIAMMLENTTNVSDSSEKVYKHAGFWQFCSAAITRKLVEKSPDNLGHCPFVIFAYETVAEPGHVTIGYRPLSGEPGSDSTITEVNDLLASIVKDAS